MKRIYITGEPERFLNYRRAVERAGGFACMGGERRRCSALLLPGGGDVEPWRYGEEEVDCREAEPMRDAAELQLIREFLEERKPILGICRGLQILNVFFGGTLCQHIEGHERVDGKDRCHESRIIPSYLQQIYGEEMYVNSAHHQAINRLGSGLAAVQWARDGVIEGIVHKNLPVWAVQWHPERLGDVGQRLIKAFLDYCVF